MNERIAKIKTHLQEHKETYIAGTVSAVVVGTTVYLVTKTRDSGSYEGDVSVSVKNLIKNSFLWKSPVTTNNFVITELVRRGHPGFKILCNQTGEVFASVRRAAEAMNVSRAALQDHLRGNLEAVSGFTFENLGEMS